MIRLNFIFVVFLNFVIVIFGEITAFGEEYLQYEVFADSNFSHVHNVCIDPGHGGPTALKCSNNGDGRGSYGYQDTLSEQWINLQIAYTLRDSLYIFGSCPNQIVLGVVMTREGWRDISTPENGGWWWRVRVANYANMGGPVNEFISIHHNGFPNPANQGTESRWWNGIRTDSSATRDTTSKLARKVSMKIHDNFNTDAGCYECYEHRATLAADFFILKNSRPVSVISEASDITWHRNEELAFEDTTVFWHAKVEASGLIRGWCSYRNNSGYVTIRNCAITGGSGHFSTKNWSIGNWIQWNSPYYTCWEEGEHWLISFPLYQNIGDVQVNFHHLEELEHGYYSTSPDYDYVVPHCSTHTIVAYWTGGPYSTELSYPNGGEQWRTCEQKSITWNASVGVDYTTKVDIYISRNGGSTFELISADLPNTGSYIWKVSGLASQQCKIKVVAHDIAGNQTFDVSDGNFTIQAHSVTVSYPNGWEMWQIDEQRTITWSSAYLCTTSSVDLYISRDGGSQYSPIVSDLGNIGSYGWTVTGPYSSNCRIKVVADDVAGNSAWDVSNHDFSISASGNNNPVIYGKIHMKCSPSEQCTLCIHYGDAVTLEVHASDPDGDSVFYDWYCDYGHFLNGQYTITTALNSVTYIAPSYFDDNISVAVNDVRGGQSIISGDIEIYGSGYSCLCGDATADSVIDMGDIVYLINYLYKNGPEPLSPKNRGDANNSCIIEIGDVVTIISYLFRSGPPPICCWIYQ